MLKEITVLKTDKEDKWGEFAYCHMPEWDSMSPDGIRKWFGKYRKLTFDDGTILEFSKILSANSFTGTGIAVLILSPASIPVHIMAPTTAYLS